jgi:hypothetical protein
MVGASVLAQERPNPAQQSFSVGAGEILLGLLAKVRAHVQQPGATRPPVVTRTIYFFLLSSRILNTSSIRARRLSGGRSLGWMVCFPV